MLKLTREDGSPVYISPVHIHAICQYSSTCTGVYFSGGSYVVRENPEQIMAMPAMVYFLNPAMVLTS